MAKTNPEASQAQNGAPELKKRSGKGWTIHEGRIRASGGGKQFQESGVTDLTYDNPFSQEVERAWYKGKLVYAIEGEPMMITDRDRIKWAKEYQPVHEVKLDDKGWLESAKKIEGQYNIYDTVPGDKGYSAIWKFYYVIVPQDYQPNTLRSEQDCLDSGYEIRESSYYEN